MWFSRSGAALSVFNPDHAAIADWLKNNLDDDDYEVVKWYPPVKMDSMRMAGAFVRHGANATHQPTLIDQLILKSEQERDSSKRKALQDRIDDELRKAALADTRYAIRLKYRIRGPFGKRLQDRLFVLDKGKLLGHYESSDVLIDGANLSSF